MRRILFMLIIFSFIATGAMSQTDPGLIASGDSASLQTTADAGNRISLDLKGMDVVEVIKMLATRGNLNVVVGGDVKGRVTIFLKSVGIMDAFDIVLVANDLACDKRGDILFVMTQKDYEALYGEKYADKKEVKIFQLKYAKATEASKALNQMKTKVGKIVVDEGSNTLVVIDSPISMTQITGAVEKIDMPTTTKIFELKYAKAADLKTKVTESLTKGIGTMQIDERTNKIVITDLGKKMEEIENMVKAFDDRLQQVLIEAKIVQITLDDKYKLGVDWDSVLQKFSKEISIKSAFQLTAQNTLTPGAQIVLGTLGAASDYAVMVQALKTIGDTNLLSSPRITALNNQEAKILVGTSQPYATNTVTQGTSTTTTGTNLSFIDVGVKLFVTPTINKDGYIIMKIKPEVSSTTANYTYGSPSTTVPIVSTTQAETSVMVKDGTTIIIAGLIKDERSSTVDKVPILGDIPLIGEAFRKTDKEIKKQEIVVFLTPHIITGENDYVQNPETIPIGEEKFTMPEKPTFERRQRVEIKPGIFKEKKSHFARREKSKEAMEKVKAEERIHMVPTMPEVYYYAVKEKIIKNIELPKGKKNKGSIKMAFFLSPNGELIYGPEILQSSNYALDEIAMNAVKKAAPFPAFPESMGKAEKRFFIDISFE